MKKTWFASIMILLLGMWLSQCIVVFARAEEIGQVISNNTHGLGGAPERIVRGTPTPSPSPAPTATPLPKVQSLAAKDTPSGIELHWESVDDAELYMIYRAQASDGSYSRMNTIEHSNVYLDSEVSAGREYWYYVTCSINQQITPPSDTINISWTQSSDITNLKITLDDMNIRRFHITWDDVVETEYEVSVYLLNPKRDESWYWSGMTVTEHEMDYEYALPNTSYQIVVREPITGKEQTETVKVPKAPSYKAFGCKAKGGSLMLVNRYDIDWGTNAWEADRKKISSIKRPALAEVLSENYLFFVSSFTYTGESTDHSFDELFTIRTPSGKVYYYDKSGWANEIEGAKKNWTWEWYTNADDLLNDLGDNYDEWETGQYVIEQYFDGYLVNSATLKVT